MGPKLPKPLTTYSVGLGDLSLRRAYESTDLRTHLLYKEFRINDIIEFLRQAKEAMKDVKPDFGVDGTWHVDPTGALTVSNGGIIASMAQST